MFNLPPFSPGPEGGQGKVPLTWLEKPGTTPLRPGNYGRAWIQVDDDGNDRLRYMEFLVPNGPPKPRPIFFSLHGGGGFAAGMRFNTLFDGTAEAHSAVACYLAGTGIKGPFEQLFWNDGRAMTNPQQEKISDLAYFDFALADVRKYTPIDPTRVYLLAHSNGMEMAYRLMVERSQRIAAIAGSAGHRALYEIDATPVLHCSAMQFSGVLDAHNPYLGGPPDIDFGAFEPYEFEPVQDVKASWVGQLGCSPAPTGVLKDVGDAHSQTFLCPLTGAEYVLWTLDDGGHTWPGGQITPAAAALGSGQINKDIYASEEAYQFCMRHRRPNAV